MEFELQVTVTSSGLQSLAVVASVPALHPVGHTTLALTVASAATKSFMLVSIMKKHVRLKASLLEVKLTLSGEVACQNGECTALL